MEKKKRKTILIIGILSILIFPVGGHFYNKYHHRYVRSKPQMYCYDDFRDTDIPVSVIIINGLWHKEHYLKYYTEIESGKKSYLHSSIPLKGMPQYSPVYVLGYTKDSLLAKVVSYYDRGARMGGSYTRGWVYAKTLHKEPPPPLK